MKVSVITLRHGIKEALRALERREQVTIVYQGKVKGGIRPAGQHPGAPPDR